MADDSEILRQESLTRLSSLLESIDGAKVTLIGDTMLDRYHHGFANNLNSTAPVPVLKILDSDESPGASAHIAIGLTSFGMDVSFHTATGDDIESKSIISTLKSMGVGSENIIQVKDRSTLTKIRFFGSRESLLDRSQILLQADRGPNEPLENSVSDSLIESARSNIPDSCALVISDYDKGVVSNDGAQTLIATANEKGIPIIVDPKLTGLEKSRGATVVIFEKRGMSLLSRRMGLDDDHAAKRLLEEYSWDGILVLGGIHGIHLHQIEKDSIFMPCMAPTADQQIGMHDAAATSLAAALGSGLDLYDAALLASAACDCVLSASTGRDYIDRATLGLWLDELAWQMRISDR
jgi:D-beta-D-heptose 7-phosphate kinase/D-beta-D-heptose 1-phosphate adenosyltransferase|tara:strand:+ start:992 stop:2044 length:1053 start_codon:yes stop_codon:yes gene_type:complete